MLAYPMCVGFIGILGVVLQSFDVVLGQSCLFVYILCW